MSSFSSFSDTNPIMQVQLFIPCFVDQLYPDTGMNMVKVLEKLGCKVTYNTKQTCCGQPAFNAGYWDEAKAVGKKFLNDFKGDGYIVGPSGSCTGYVRNYYNKMLENSPERMLSNQVSAKMYEFTEFLTD